MNGLVQKKPLSCQSFSFGLWFAEEPHCRSHLRSGEHLGVLLVALGTHRFPHAAREVHLFAKVPQGTAIVVAGVIHLG